MEGLQHFNNVHGYSYINHNIDMSDNKIPNMCSHITILNSNNDNKCAI